MISVRLGMQRPGFALQVDERWPAQGVTAIFGASGCGKTTLLRAIAGLDRAVGRVAIGDEVWQDDAAGEFVPTHRRGIGYVIQDAALFPHLDVRGNLQYGLARARGAGPRIALEHVVGLLGIGGLMQRRSDSLSGGERQRVAIARALATSPRLLLMDEPLAALDAQRKREVLPYLEALHRELGLPILYVSHAIDEVARLADHLVLMDAGTVRASGPLDETLARLDVPVALGDDAGVVLHAVVGERDARWQLARLDVNESCRFWARDAGQPPGQAVRVRISARDVSLAVQPQAGTSIQNQLAGEVEAIAQDRHPANVLVRVRIGGAVVLARVTARAAHALGLAPGLRIWAQVKSVALVE